MRFVWGFGCIAVVIATTFVLSKSNFLLVDSLYAVLAGSVVGICFLVGSLMQGRDADVATRLLFFSVVGSVAGFAVAWSLALLLGLRFMSDAALAFDLVAGAIGASVLTATVFRRDAAGER